MLSKYDVTIGLEVHVELATKSKIFCGCSTAFGAKPNTHTCPVCIGMPGSLPVLNKKVLEYAMAVGLATNCDITRFSKFDRKNYFYPDNPQNYQISQLYMPICRNGFVEINTCAGNKKIGIHEIHMEEDAGKLIHDEITGNSYVDYNRSGVPLIEIVTEPDMSSEVEVVTFLEKLRLIIQYLEASDCKLNEGSMRVDVNLSVKRRGETELGTRTEMKNLNSFKAITRAIENESSRQISMIENGKKIHMETRRWDDIKGCSFSMRSKEDARDYRYFPEPDVLPVMISDEWISKVISNQPEFKDEKMERYIKEYGIPKYDADIITSTKHMAGVFEKAVELGGDPKKISNFLMGETMRLLKDRNMEADKINFSPKNLVRLIKLVDDGVINGNIAKEVFEKIFDEDVDPHEYVERQGLKMESDEEWLLAVIKDVIENNTQSVSDYKNGKERALGFLIGQIMKETSGKANPAMVRKLLLENLQG
ncbi:MAG: Asp-tRNA(Asn)/Glu-tRNA(Gln) amidotransferase subunit GatB [Lachnospiraceae bacterium]|nr:Asp-tRNA(Asn)/Glu-tRNA(Gln) amidotransferase subunit GatB [Lachnospiraceae bacterium]